MKHPKQTNAPTSFAELLAEASIKPGVHVLHVGHDDDCPVLAGGGGACTCTCTEIEYSLRTLGGES